MGRVWLMASCAVVFTACDPPEMISERGDFRLSVDDLDLRGDYLADTYWEAPYLVLTGTRICPQLACDACPDAATCDDAGVHASGPVTADGGCFVAAAPGEVVWTVDATCGAPGQPPDRVTMRVVDPAEVEARAAPWLDGMVMRHAVRDNPIVTTFGADWLESLPRELKLVAGQQLEVGVNLFERGTRHVVARQSEPAEVTWTTTRGRPPITYPSEHLAIVTFEGTEAEATFNFAGHSWPLARITGVAADTVTSLELAGAYLVLEDSDAPLIGRTSVPFGARAVARDAGDDLVFGLPVTWSVAGGDIAYIPELTQPEQIVLADDCVAPEEREGPRELVLRGSLGDMSASLEFSWAGTREVTPLNFVPVDSDWQPPATCLAAEGCGCRSTEPGAPALLLLGLLGLGRRRRSAARSGMRERTDCNGEPSGPTPPPASAERPTPSARSGMFKRSGHGAAPAGPASGLRERGLASAGCSDMFKKAWRKGHARSGMLAGTCLVMLAGCGVPPALQVAEALPLGDLPLRDGGPAVEQGGHSVGLGSRALWGFRVTTDVGSPSQDVTAAAVTDDLDARDGLHPFAIPAAVDPEFLPYAAGEARYGLAYDDGACLASYDCPRVSLWPGPMVHDHARQRVLIFYRKVIQFEDNADNQHVGSSIAVWRDDLAGRPVRPAVAEGSAEPTLLFGADELPVAAALSVGDHLYAFTCGGRRGACNLMRAPLAHALERGAWRHYTGAGWSASARRASAVFAGAGAMSVHWSDHAGAFVAVYADRDEPVVVLRTAPQLEGPWSEAAELYRPPALQGAPPIQDALLHPELAQAGGAVDYLTYYEGPAWSELDPGGALKLVEIHWE
ncbi:DUF4185 domain-containing protein [Nannocystis bainbridge]|uniref:DUF4185 domain-containing protein n=1 Tax=Nannocystis bainbridge TaxID=2995303 RepID=A0ABT5DUS7_9BACT|nr:DUF4185 domain-containing protein [Nannocystis bainbridge]MDC0717389.1 DUF4185 domain-containing protein [Nannocystis bainbridge]